MRRVLLLALAYSTLACSDSSGPNEPTNQSGLLGRWTGTSVPVPGSSTSVSINAVIAETGGALTGSGLLTILECPGSPYAVTVTGARAGAAVSFTLLPRELNFTGQIAADSIDGTLTGLGCGGFALGTRRIVLRR